MNMILIIKNQELQYKLVETTFVLVVVGKNIKNVVGNNKCNSYVHLDDLN